MIRGDLAPRDLPGAWNERVRRDLGIEVPDDARGCLQDVHWSMGYIGYFPTYSLGSLYAAQFWKSAEVAIPGLDARIGEGDFAPLLAWLRERIHSQGRRYSADELCRQIAGESLSHEPLIEHLASKIDELYPGV